MNTEERSPRLFMVTIECINDTEEDQHKQHILYLNEYSLKQMFDGENFNLEVVNPIDGKSEIIREQVFKSLNIK